MTRELYFHEQLEHDFGKWIGGSGRHYVACSSGTAALHLALEALEIERHSVVLVPEFAMVACARAVVLADLVPSFTDVDERLLMNCEFASARITGKVKAIMPVHTYGRVCEMRSLRKLADKHCCLIIEDCAEAHGANNAGVFSDAACWSFYKNKIIHGEEGGMVSFASKEAACRAKLLRNMGFTEKHDFTHIPRGHNYRMSNLHAYVICQSLANASDNFRKRYFIERWMNDVVTSPKVRRIPRDVPWVYDVRIPGLSNLDGLVEWLHDNDVDARHGFKPLSQQPEFRDLPEECNEPFMEAQWASREVLYIPINTELEFKEVERQASLLQQGIERFA